MRLFRKIRHVCQNCIHSNNEKGKKLKDCHWYIFCEKKKKYYKWDNYKRCFEPQEWVIKMDNKFT